ncbi:DUF3592 domain-containing protein [Nocardioides sp. Soil774]|uniref:DUF3592 domain-containing protein n=1 Tax=Nocardioides sp. Soil774 TaxID=1736408 RepID=UPI0006F20D62|nr:DUF3592 domain-containing protein [Nocardioides sp. Soil774]
MRPDPRPGFEQAPAPARRWLPYAWLALAVLAIMLVIGMSFPALHAGLLGRTHQVTAEVVSSHSEGRCCRSDRTVHDVRWSDADGVHTAALATCGPLRYDVGDRVRVWVAPGVTEARRESPRTLWWSLVLVPPVVVVLLVAALGWVGRIGARLRRRAG